MKVNGQWDGVNQFTQVIGVSSDISEYEALAVMYSLIIWKYSLILWK